MNELRLLSEKLLEKEYEIAKEITNIKSYTELGLNQSVINELIDGRAKLIHILALALQEKDSDAARNGVIEWAKMAGQSAIDNKAPMESTLSTSKLYRKHIWKYIRRISAEHNLSLETVFDASSIIDPLMDDAVYIFSLSYVQYHEQILRNTKDEFLKISSPVVKIFENVAVLPLIGEIDADRARIILDKTLSQAAKFRLSHLVIDLSGVTLIDDMVAQEIIKIAESLKLLGIKAVLTGILPDMAHTIIQQGIDLHDIETLGTLDKAIKELI
ncbi:STAS domain-containing protein [Bacillus sp. AK031]